ncbi:MAG: glycoside hydrolase family 127 protein [Bacteroidota bacterium]|nr:glycoside hydrolase family 127 protein [Bacteroidota bacterium]
MKNILFKILITGIAACYLIPAIAQTDKIRTFKLSQVRLLESPFLSAEQTDLDYMLRLEPDRLLAPFLREAGLKPKAQSYGNWENTGLDGHTAGHYLTALAQMYAATGSAECKRRLDYMVSELGRCQVNNGNGYIGGIPGGLHMWALFKLGDFSEFNKKWVPWYNLHKLFAGLRDCYLLEGNQQARQEFLKLADWTANETNGLSDTQMQTMLNMEQGGMDEVLADAYAFTGNLKYLKLAERFCHRLILDPLEKHEDQLTGLHANTQIPKVIGFERIAELSNDSSYHSAARFFWQTVVRHRSISIGGNSVREHFNPTDNFSSMVDSEQGPETCNSNNMLKLSKMLFLNEGRPEYIDFYERLLYNHILSSQRPVTGGFVYFTPIHPQHYRVYSTASESFWCCVGTGMENHGKYGELIYTHNNDNLYVNLFIPSVLNWTKKGVKLIQRNKFPDEEGTTLSLDILSPKKFSLLIRRPYWVADGGFKIKINGKTASVTSFKGGYAEINRIWHNGDRITIALPMTTYTESLPDNSGWVSFLHGPIVLAAPTDTTNMPGLFADDSRWGHIANGPLYALTGSPQLIRSGDNPASAIERSVSPRMSFEMGDLILQQGFKNLKLIPFYRVQNTRYMLYWPITTKDSVSQKEKELAALDEKYLRLAPLTIDAVSPGEQQSEADHHLQENGSITGFLNNTHWRSASGFFSYQMRFSPFAKILYVSCQSPGKNCSFDILVNKLKIAHVESAAKRAEQPFSAEYALPPDIKSGPITVEIIAVQGSRTMEVSDIRLLRKEK